MNQTHEQLMDKIIFRRGEGANYDGRIEDIRGYRRAMKDEAEEKADKKVGRWARLVAWVKTLGKGRA